MRLCRCVKMVWGMPKRHLMAHLSRYTMSHTELFLFTVPGLVAQLAALIQNQNQRANTLHSMPMCCDSRLEYPHPWSHYWPHWIEATDTAGNSSILWLLYQWHSMGFCPLLGLWRVVEASLGGFLGRLPWEASSEPLEKFHLYILYKETGLQIWYISNLDQSGSNWFCLAVLLFVSFCDCAYPKKHFQGLEHNVFDGGIQATWNSTQIDLAVVGSQTITSCVIWFVFGQVPITIRGGDFRVCLLDHVLRFQTPFRRPPVLLRLAHQRVHAKVLVSWLVCWAWWRNSTRILS